MIDLNDDDVRNRYAQALRNLQVRKKYVVVVMGERLRSPWDATIDEDAVKLNNIDKSIKIVEDLIKHYDADNGEEN